MTTLFTDKPDLASIEVNSSAPTFASFTHSGKRQVRSRNAQQWSIFGEFPPLSRADFDPLWAFVLGKNGRTDTFTFIPPIYGSAKGDVSSCTASAASAGASVVAVTMTGTLKAGDYVKFLSHDKVYIVTSDLTGNGDLSIFPALHNAVGEASSVTYDDVPFTVAFASDVHQFARKAADLHSFSFELVEII